MPVFLAELYLSAADPASRSDALRRLDTAAARLRRAGTHVRARRPIYLPQDETYLIQIEADSKDAVTQLALAAALCFDRISEAEPAMPTSGKRADA